ncbi:MAG: proton-conducting transporter membrane subunit [Wenzhouxiangellaceae bacterium]|nr:proton-conducting transporter membrane subunit [Wenzhouxiangellaceae bacterium]
MPIEWLPVGIFYLGALLAAASRGARWIALATPIVAALVAMTLLSVGTAADWPVMDYTLAAVRVDAMTLVFVGLFHLAALLAAIYALEWIDRVQASSMLAYVGSGIGAVLAGDLVVLWLFWEMLALTSVVLIWARRTPEATAAGIRYLVFNVVSGVVLLAGIAALASAGHDLAIGPSAGTIGLDSPGGWLVLIAFGIKAGFPLLHNWIPDGYANASLTGSVILVAITTKVGVYSLARAFAGEELLMVVGTVMALWPLAYVLVEDDLRRVLAYSLMVQIGLMVVAIGAGNAIALDGVTLHVVMDVLFKMLLFMALGAVLVQAGTVRASELGGLARRMPWTLGFVLVGTLANSALPGTGAFVSKKLLLGGIEYAGIGPIWYGALAGLSALGMLYLGVRIVYQAFLRPPKQPVTAADASFPMRVAMGTITLLIVLAGLFPGLTDALRPMGSDYNPFKLVKILDQLQLLLFALLTWMLLAGRGFGLPEPGRRVLLDAEWVYRRLLPGAALAVAERLAAVRDAVVNLVRLSDRRPGNSRVAATLARSWPIGSMAFWTVVVLAALLFAGIWRGI